MEEIKNEDKVLLDQEELEKVTGGSEEEMEVLRTLAEIESSPIFSKLKNRLKRYKDAGYSKTADSTTIDLINYGMPMDYFITSPAAIKFIKVYWDIV